MIGAYRLLSGEDNPCQNCGNGSAASNYVYGNEAADDAYKGSTPSDQPDAIPIHDMVTGTGRHKRLSRRKMDVLFTMVFNGQMM